MKGKAMIDGEEQYLLKCNFHTHYAEFYGDKPEIMVDAYYAAGYDCIALTEHDDVVKDLEGEKRAQLYASEKYGSDFLVILGEELAFNDRNNSGCDIREVLGLFLSEFIVSGRKSQSDYASLIDGQKALNEVHRQGGIAIICHDNWLVWCLEYMGRGRHPWMWDFRHALPIDGWEVGNGIASLLNEEKAGKDLMLSHPQESVDEGYIVLANSDAHKTEEIELSTCYTYLFAKQKTPQGVKEALLYRRTVAFCNGKMYGAEKLVCLLREYLSEREVLVVPPTGERNNMTYSGILDNIMRRREP